jgi:bacteriorhodopsin
VGAAARALSSREAVPPTRRILLVAWFVYPIVFGLQGATSGGAWATTAQLLLCAADVVAKVGFGLLIQKVAKLRTAFDVQTGLETHPETLWINGERHSDALYPASSSASSASADPLESNPIAALHR